jgi:hypothetical protein
MLGTAACRAGASHALPRTTTTRRPSDPPSASTATSTTAAPAPLTTTVPLTVAWTGPVAHLFFHTLVIHPELAFTHDSIGQGFRDWYVTVAEFRAILDQLYANRWTLVDIHRAVDGRVRVPAGRKPLVLSEDDVNYYDDTRPRGIGWKLALDADGAVKVEVHDGLGVRLTDDDIVPMVDEFVARHPDFSADGAKGVIGVTGYEGVLGERVDDTASPDWAASVARARAVAQRLRATGWTFASHSYGHFDETKGSVGRLVHDSEEWKAQDEPIVGPTDVYIYPFGAGLPIDSPKIDVLRSFGFTILCDIDIVPRFTRGNGVTIMTRLHVDGVAFEDGAKRLAPFFDVATVEDQERGHPTSSAAEAESKSRPPSGVASTTMVSPSRYFPSSRLIAIGSASCFCNTRLSGRAP